MNNFLYDFLKDKVSDHPETEVIKNLPIYKTPYKNSPEFEKRPYWFLHNKLKKKLYDCLPTLRHPTRPPPTWSELMNTSISLPACPAGANLADSFRLCEEKVQIKQLRLWILGCLSAKNQTWQDFLNERIRAASNLGVSSNGTGLGDILYNFEKKCERDYNNKLETAGPGALELARRQRGRRASAATPAALAVTDPSYALLVGELRRREAAASEAAARRQELEDEAYARRQRGRRASAATEEEMDPQRRLDFQGVDQGGRRRTKKKRKKRKRKKRKGGRRTRRRKRRRKTRRRGRRKTRRNFYNTRRQHGGNQYGRQMAMAPPLPPPPSPR